MAEIYDATVSYLDRAGLPFYAWSINDWVLIRIQRGKYNVTGFKNTSW